MPITIDKSELNGLGYKKLSDWLDNNSSLDQNLWLSLITSTLFVQTISLPTKVTGRFLNLFNQKLIGTQISRNEPFAQFLYYFLNNQTASLNKTAGQVATFVLGNQGTVKALFSTNDNFILNSLPNVITQVDDETSKRLNEFKDLLAQPAPLGQSTPAAPIAPSAAPIAPIVSSSTPPSNELHPHTNQNLRPVLLIAAISVIAIALTGYGLIAIVGLSVALGLLAATGAGIGTGCIGYGLFRCSQAHEARISSKPANPSYAQHT